MRKTDSLNADILDSHDAAKLLRISTKTLLRLAQENKVPARRLGRVWRFSRRRLEAYVAGDE